MRACVKSLKVDSGNEWSTATIILSRHYEPYQPKPSDLPADLRAALLEWLGIGGE
jgi:hypothetical protein